MIHRLTALLLVLLLYLLIGGVLAEGVVRVLRLAPPTEAPGYFWRTNEPATGWTLQPGAAGRWFNRMYEYDQMIQINSQGLRSPDVCVAVTQDCGCDIPVSGAAMCDRENVLRILVLGDSYVEAMHVPLEATFPQKMGARLMNARLADGRQVEVINAGVSGWGTDQQLLWLREHGPRYKPDLIVLAFYPGNDFMNNHMALEYANFGNVRKPWFALEGDELTLNDYPYDSETARESIPQFEARLAEVMPESAADKAADEAAHDAAEESASVVDDGARPLEPLGNWLGEVSALYRYIEPRIRVSAPDIAVNLARWGLITPGQETSDRSMGPSYIPVTYGVYRAEPHPVWQEAFDITGALFHELHAEAQGLDAELAAVVLTAPEQVDRDRWELELTRYPTMQTVEWSLEQPTQVALDLLAEAEIPALNLLPLFREATDNGAYLHFRDDGHWTEEGHAFAGALTANFLAVQGKTTLAAGTIVPVEIPAGSPHWVLWLLAVVVAILILSIGWGAYQIGFVAWARGAWTGLGTTGELLLFTIRRGQYVVLPLLVVLILFGGLLLIAQSSVVGPFIYPLF